MTNVLVPRSDPNNQPAADLPEIMVGVTGHRPTRLRRADLSLLRNRIRESLQTIQTAIPNGALTVLSPLAEGADQIVARVALELGCELDSVLPFARDVYANDFPTAAAKAEYRALLALAASVVELDGSRTSPEERDSAYAEVGNYTVSHSTILLAIWDGQQARGNGGTGDVVATALQVGRPVVWILADPPHSIRVLHTADDGRVLDLPIHEATELFVPQAPVS